jgi:hypothetical protein
MEERPEDFFLSDKRFADTKEKGEEKKYRQVKFKKNEDDTYPPCVQVACLGYNASEYGIRE